MYGTQKGIKAFRIRALVLQDQTGLTGRLEEICLHSVITPHELDAPALFKKPVHAAVVNDHVAVNPHMRAIC